MKVLQLEQYEHLFKDSESYDTFVRRLKEYMSDDFNPVLSGTSLLGVCTSSNNAKNILAGRLASGLTDKKLLE